jgi:hypothetical protein
MCRVQVRELLLRKKERLVEQLKALAATIPTNLMSATSNKFSDLERQLKAKAGSLEEVDAQRKYVRTVHSRTVPGVHTLPCWAASLVCDAHPVPGVLSLRAGLWLSCLARWHHSWLRSRRPRCVYAL